MLIPQKTENSLKTAAWMSQAEPSPEMLLPALLTHPCYLELNGVCMSPVHQGGVHLTADATVSIVYVQAASTAVLETWKRVPLK